MIRNDEPAYVILDARYQELVEGYEEAYMARVKAAPEDVRAGPVRQSSAQEIIREFDRRLQTPVRR